MVQKSSYEQTLEIFFIEPTEIHFIKEISKKINIAHTSIRKNIKFLLEGNLIIPKNSKPFSGYVANRENPEFIALKRNYNLNSLNKLKNYLELKLSPKLAVLFGSYSLGEDMENSDIDLLIITKKNKIEIKEFEKELKREINLLILDNLNKLEKPILNKVYNGIVISGGFDLL